MIAIPGLDERALSLIRQVLGRHHEVTGAVLFGSRAKGISRESSDVDLALEGLDDALAAERVAGELEELPLPYRFDVKALGSITSRPLLDHIARVGVRIYGAASGGSEKPSRVTRGGSAPT